MSLRICKSSHTSSLSSNSPRLFDRASTHSPRARFCGFEKPQIHIQRSGFFSRLMSTMIRSCYHTKTNATETWEARSRLITSGNTIETQARRGRVCTRWRALKRACCSMGKLFLMISFSLKRLFGRVTVKRSWPLVIEINKTAWHWRAIEHFPIRVPESASIQSPSLQHRLYRWYRWYHLTVVFVRPDEGSQTTSASIYFVSLME